MLTTSKNLLDLGLFTTNAITSDGCLTTRYVSSRRSTVEWNIDPGNRCLLDSGTDFTVFGYAFEPFYEYKGSDMAVQGGVDGDGGVACTASLCDAESVITTLDGMQYRLRVYYGINHCHKRLQETLLQPLAIREAGNYVSDRHLFEDDSPNSQCIIANGTKLCLHSNGVHMYFHARKPLDTDKNLPIIELNRKMEWDPSLLFQKAHEAQRQFKHARINQKTAQAAKSGTTKILPHQKARRNNVSKHKLVDRLLPVYGEMTEEDKKNINEFSGLPSRALPIVNLVGYKQNRKIWNGHAPKQRQIFLNGKWVSIFDPYYPDLKPVYQQQLLDHWKKIFNSDDDSLIASTLSATTQRHALLTADKRNILQKRHVCHFPQLSRNRLDGTVHTDTAFCNVLGSRRENSFQLFYHSPTAHVHVEPMRGKSGESVCNATKLYSTQVGTPNHIHGDRAAELQHGEMEAYCISNAIMLTATGEHNSPEQDTHAERMIGVLKYMSFALLQKANLKPSFWPHSLKYAAIVWNFTAKRRLGNRLPQELIKGCTQDLSFLMFPFGSPVRYRHDDAKYPSSTGMSTGIYLGPNMRDGDVYTGEVYDPSKRRIFSARYISSSEKENDLDIYVEDVLSTIDFFRDSQHEIPVDPINSDWIEMEISAEHSTHANELALQTHDVQQSGGDAHTDDKPVAITGM